MPVPAPQHTSVKRDIWRTYANRPHQPWPYTHHVNNVNKDALHEMMSIMKVCAPAYPTSPPPSHPDEPICFYNNQSTTRPTSPTERQVAAQ